MSAVIKKVTGQDVKLIGGGGGIFEIREDGKLLLKKERGGDFPTNEEAATLFHK